MGTVIFDSEIAAKVGVNAAIIYERIRYFCEDAHAKRDVFKYHEGAYWTYNSRSGWQNMLPFLTDEQIKKAILKLKSHNLIRTGSFNKSSWDKTTWYTIVGSPDPIEWVPAPDPFGYMTQSVGSTEPISCVARPNQLGPQNLTIPNESSNESTNKSNNYLAQSPKRRPREFDFDSLYLKYPKKEGKSRGLKICATQVKTDQDFENLSKAIDNYSQHCTFKIKDSKFIKHFSTFMAEWRDWIDVSNHDKDVGQMTGDEFAQWLGLEDYEK